LDLFLTLIVHANGLVCRFLATVESYANPIYKRKVIELNETEYTDVFGRARWPDAPHRVLKTPFFKEWRSLPTNESEANKPVIGHSTIHGVVKFWLAFISLVKLKASL
jgi:NAD(P)H-dependent flavin oxidoreductase YrpB (nitropropane dioxygenase family)